MKKILINSKSSEETRIATLDNGKLIDLDIENIDREQKKANVYKGYISRIEPSLNAVFVNYGEEKNGFLPFKEISDYYLKDNPNEDRSNIGSLLTEGQELIVQIDKEERGDKGAALTTFIALAGSYMVLLPNNPNGGGISRRVEGPDRDKLKQYLKDLQIPTTMSVIARTACVECSFEELKFDFDNLRELWSSISQAYHKIKKPALLHKESDIIVRTVRDHLKDDVKEIVVDTKECFDDVKRQLGLLRQGFDANKVKLYNEDLPIFSTFNIDQQIENAYKREIRLPSGGSIVIDTTEALVAVDVNSSRANKADDVETTAFKTNLEAAEEVARQLRIRDLGGLVIIDFIDMSAHSNRKEVEETLMNALLLDKARIQMSKISKLGLVEISRQRLSASLNESVMQKCPRCEGHGFIKTTQATALTILRKIRVESMKDDTNEIRVQLPVDIAAYILNEKRDSVVDIEKSTNVKVMLIPNFNMESPRFQMQRIWGSSYKSNRTSPELIEDVYNVEVPVAPKKKVAAADMVREKASKPQAKTEQKAQPEQESRPKAEVKAPAKKKGLLSKVATFIFGEAQEEKAPQKKVQKNQPQKNNKYEAKKDFKKNDSRNNRDQKPRSNDFKKNDSRNNENKDFKKNDSRNNRDQKPRSNDNKGFKKDDSRNNRDNKDNRDNQDRKNSKFDKRSSNRNQSGGRSNLSLNNAEKVIDVTKVKYQEKTKVEAVDNIKKVISKNPQEFVSVMVKDVLENYENLKDNSAQKVTTDEKVKTNKYLKFETVSLDALEKSIAAEEQAKKKEAKAKLDAERKAAEEAKNAEIKEQQAPAQEVAAEKVERDAPKAKETTKEAKTEKPVAKKEKSKEDKKAEPKKKTPAKQEEKSDAKDFIDYSPALSAESQSII